MDLSSEVIRETTGGKKRQSCQEGDKGLSLLEGKTAGTWISLVRSLEKLQEVRKDRVVRKEIRGCPFRSGKWQGHGSL